MNMEEITDKLVNSVMEAMGQSGYVQVEISARHVHLSQHDLEALFGAGAKLTPKRPLSQPGQYLAGQRVALIGPQGRKENVAVLGPVRKDTQIELSRSDAMSLGVQAPLRESGDIEGSGEITIQGPEGMIHVTQGTIVAHNHIHMTPEEAGQLGLADKQHVAVEVAGERPVVFKDVIVRVNKDFRLRMHIDFDEANAGDIGKLAFGKIILGNAGGGFLVSEPQGSVLRIQTARESASQIPISRESAYQIQATRVSASQDTVIPGPISPSPTCAAPNLSQPPNRPALLLLPQGNYPPGMPNPEESGLDRELLEREFDLLHAKKLGYHPDWNRIEGVIAFGLTVEALGKIASGVLDNCYTKAMSQAILRGKPIYILRSQVELYQYEKSAPTVYFKKLQEHLTLLERSGLTVLGEGRLEAAILQKARPKAFQKAPKTVFQEALNEASPKAAEEPSRPMAPVKPSRPMAPVEPSRPIVPQEGTEGNQWILTKHLVVESDLAQVKNGGGNQVAIAAGTIITDLARDYARNHNITIIRG